MWVLNSEETRVMLFFVIFYTEKVVVKEQTLLLTSRIDWTLGSNESNDANRPIRLEIHLLARLVDTCDASRHSVQIKELSLAVLIRFMTIFFYFFRVGILSF